MDVWREKVDEREAVSIGVKQGKITFNVIPAGNKRYLQHHADLDAIVGSSI